MGIPMKEAEFVTYGTNFNQRLNATPLLYSITAPQALAFDTLWQAFVDAQVALNESRSTGVQSKQLTAVRNAKRAEVLPTMRAYYAQIQASLTIPDDAKVAIGVHVKAKTPSRTPAPIVRPGMDVVSVFDRTISLSIHDSASSTKRGRPAGATQAFVYYFVGTSYPSDPTLWSFAGAATTNKFDVTLPDSVPAGAQVWVCAAWTNRRGQAGPVNLPISTRIQGGGSVIEPAAMKLAA